MKFKRSGSLISLVLIIVISYYPYISSLKHKLLIKDDDRTLFKIETFGFIKGGVMDITISNFEVKNNHARKDKADTAVTKMSEYKLGFVMRKTESESEAQQDIESFIDKGICILDHSSKSASTAPGNTVSAVSNISGNINRHLFDKDDIVIDLSARSVETWKKTTFHFIIPDDNVSGLYSLIFARCLPVTSTTLVSFELEASFYNPSPLGPNYLSAGDVPLPLMYFMFFLAFLATAVVWCVVVFKCCGYKGTVHKIHYLMIALLVLKCFTLLFESIRYHYISQHGVSTESWSVLYYIFASLKAILLFTVILLIGSGWSLFKGYLNDKEKRIIFFVLVLQVLNNVAMIVLDETSPGSQSWLTWRDILHLVDIVCCCAVLFPIIWSIRHLRQAAEIDGKAQLSLQKLKLFRSFYIMVVVYIYFTRIIVLLLSATVPFHLIWLGDFFSELATLAFYCITGYQFRPATHNPYLPVQTDDQQSSELNEYGLEHDGDDDIEHYSGNSTSSIPMTSKQ